VTRPRAEHGSALVEVTWLTLFLVVPLVYFVLSVFVDQCGQRNPVSAMRHKKPASDA